MKNAVISIFLWQLAFPLIESLPAWGLPPPEDTPEEVLRTEIIIEARSPIDGNPLTAAEYAELKAQLEGRQPPDPQVNPKLRELIFLLQLRHQIRQILPFVDF
jgi:hypothetical protein